MDSSSLFPRVLVSRSFFSFDIRNEMAERRLALAAQKVQATWEGALVVVRASLLRFFLPLPTSGPGTDAMETCAFPATQVADFYVAEAYDAEPPATQPRPDETPVKTKSENPVKPEEEEPTASTTPVKTKPENEVKPEEHGTPSSLNAPTMIMGQLSPTVQEALDGEGQEVKRLDQIEQRAAKRAKGKGKGQQAGEDGQSDDGFGAPPKPTGVQAKAKAKAKAILAKAKAKAVQIENKAKAKAKAAGKKASPKGRSRKPAAKKPSKAKAKAAKPKGKASKPGQGKRKAAGSVKASFARRNQPDREPGHSFWKAARSAFEAVIQEKVRSPSTSEIPFWKHCQKLWDEVLPGGDISQYDAAAHTIAKNFLLTPDVKGCWDIAWV